MAKLPHTHEPPVGIGLLSLVLGTVGLLICFMPILGLPLSACGLLLGITGCCLALAGGRTSLRWSVGGTCVCGLVLLINFAIAMAPRTLAEYRPGPQMWQPVPDVPFVAPPATPLTN